MAWLEDGMLFDSTLFSKPLVFSPGRHSVIRGVEQLVIGMSVGESKTKRIPPELAFGCYRPEIWFQVPRSLVMDHDIDPAVGMRLEVRNRTRTTVHMDIIELTDAHVTIDTNHPFAGKSITVQLDLLAILDGSSPGISRKSSCR